MVAFLVYGACVAGKSMGECVGVQLGASVGVGGGPGKTAGNSKTKAPLRADRWQHACAALVATCWPASLFSQCITGARSKGMNRGVATTNGSNGQSKPAKRGWQASVMGRTWWPAQDGHIIAIQHDEAPAWRRLEGVVAVRYHTLLEAGTRGQAGAEGERANGFRVDEGTERAVLDERLWGEGRPY